MVPKPNDYNPYNDISYVYKVIFEELTQLLVLEPPKVTPVPDNEIEYDATPVFGSIKAPHTGEFGANPRIPFSAF